MNENEARELTFLLLNEYMKVSVIFTPSLVETEHVYGRCWNNPTGAVIEYDPEYLNRNLVAHECAHALTPGAGHGKIWRSQYRLNQATLDN